MKYPLVLLMMLCLVKADVIERPLWEPLGQPDQVSYDKQHNVFVDGFVCFDNWMLHADHELVTKLTHPRRIPAKSHIVLSLRKDLFNENKQYLCAGTFLQIVKPVPAKRRLVLINVEEVLTDLTRPEDKQYRVWPHLGILFIGTVAHEEGYEVVLWDELVQGLAPLEKLIKQDDIVGLSLVATGIERGVTIARKAKELGARYVIAGNDSAIFRSNQLLNIPEKPIDAVFTSNSLFSVRQFFREIQYASVDALIIPDVQTKSGLIQASNIREKLVEEIALRRRLKQSGTFDEHDVFIVPKLDLFSEAYWQEVWSNYRSEFGHKHSNPDTVRNALALFAQGCTRTRGTDVCLYCTIAGVADLRLPSRKYLVATAEAYKRFGIDMVFNVTDSVLEMQKVVQVLKEENIRYNAMTIYGRAQGIARAPHLLDDWLSVVNDRLLINVGMDSGDDKPLKEGIHKSSIESGSRVADNRQAVELIKKSGAHLHYSLIFGSPGETRESCERSMEFLEWTIDTLGDQLDICETDIFWLNFGAPASRVFYSYDYARELAEIAGKSISAVEWYRDFASQKEKLTVPLKTEKAWYEHFTNIDYDEAQAYNRRVIARMARHNGSIRGRAYKPTA